MLAAIANTFSNCFKIPELKSRILFTLMVLAICRVEAIIRIPGLDGSALAAFFEKNAQSGAGVLGMYSLFTGGALEHCAVGALGIMPYISATIIIQLLSAVVPQLSKLAREEGGRTKLIQYRRYLTVILCLGQGLVIAGVIAITQAQRKVPVQYAQRAVGRKVYSGGTSFMPLRVNYSGVMPIIFAQAILMFPQKFFQLVHGALANNHNPGAVFISNVAGRLSNLLAERSYFYLLVYALMILFFSYFWVATQFNELQIADDLKKNGGYIPGVRPGQATSDYLHNAMSRITLAGAVFLTVIAVIPILLYRALQIPYPVATFFGGTSMLIMVGVLLDTMRQMETHLLMRHYDGFLKKGRLRGRF